MIIQSKSTTLLLSSLELSLQLKISIKNKVSNLNNIKLVVIPIIFYRYIHQNNRNDLTFMINIYFYFAKA